MTNQKLETITKIEIAESTEDNYIKYTGQPQPAYIEIDFRDGTVHSTYSSDSGGSMPAYIWNGRGSRFSINSYLTVDSINDLMESIKADLQSLQNLYDTDVEDLYYYDGCIRPKQAKYEAMQDADNRLQYKIDNAHDSLDLFNVYTAVEWLEYDDDAVLALLKNYKSLSTFCEAMESNLEPLDKLDADEDDFRSVIAHEIEYCRDETVVKNLPEWAQKEFAEEIKELLED